MTTTFYAYIHCKPDGVPFYVGKGHGNRYRSVKDRSEWHRRIVKNHGTPLVALLECSSEATAFELEKGLIRCLRRSGVVLCNLTDGGEGTTGHTVSPESRAVITSKLKAHYSDPKNRERLKLQGQPRTPAEKKRLSEVNKGKTISKVQRERTSAVIQAWWDTRKALEKAALPKGTDRVCRSCKQPKALSDFVNNRNKPYGKGDVCRPCACTAAANYRAKKRACG